MKTIAVLYFVLLVAIVANAQTVIYAPAPPATPAPGYTYYNTISPSGQSQTGVIYTQPSTPTTGFQQDMSTGQQSTYITNGNSTVILPLNSGK
jgi:hypothetical protein